MRKTALALAILGVLILAVALVSWAALPGWRETPGGLWLLLTAAATGVVILVKGVLEIVKIWRELREEKGKPGVTAEGKRGVAISDAGQAIVITGDGSVVYAPRPEAPGLETPPAPPVYGGVPPRHLRPPVPTFTGRARELAEIPAHLSAGGGGAALIAGLTGMGGVGKTELAYGVAHRLRETYPDGQLVVHLKGTTEPISPQEALGLVIHAFEPQARLPDDLAALRGLCCSLLAGKQVLLLLDDAASTAQVRPLLEVPVGIGVLVTSRRRLALPGLRRWDVDLLSLKEAVELLRKTGLSRKDVDETAWQRIAGLCGRLPLALRVAGAMLEITPDLTGAEYAASLTDEKRRLSALRPEDDPEGDVGAVLGLSVVRLEREYPEWAARWTLLGLLPPATFDAGLVAALWGQTTPTPAPSPEAGEGSLPRLEPLAEEETRETLHALVRRNLLDWDGEARRYFLHDLLRLYALGRAEERLDADEREAARLRHALHVLAGARRSNELYKAGGDGVLAGLALLDDILPHLRAAVAWASTPSPLPTLGEGRGPGGGERARLAVLLPDAAAHPLDLRLPPREKIPWLEGAVAAAHALGDRQAEGAHLGNLGNAWAALGEVRKAIDFYEQALAISREIGDRRGEGNRLGNLGLAWAALGEVRKAIDFYEQALAISREIGDRRGEGNDLGNLGLAWANLGEVRKAIDFYEQALAISREIGDRRGEGADLGNLGLAWANLGEVRKAIDFYEQALAISREIGDRRGEGADLNNLGLIWADLGEVRKAVDLYGQALEIRREIGDRRGEGNDLGNLGNAWAALGEVRKAIDFYEQALEIRREIGDRRGEGNDLANIGQAYRELGDLEQARRLWQQALEIYEAIEDPHAEWVRRWLEESEER